MTFWQILPKNLTAAYIFSNTTMTNLKKLIGNKLLNAKAVSSRIISQNYPPKPLWETLGMGENIQPTAKNLLISPSRKILFDIFISYYQKCHSLFYIK